MVFLFNKGCKILNIQVSLTYLYFWKKLDGSSSFDQSDFPWRISSVTIRPVLIYKTTMSSSVDLFKSIYSLSTFRSPEFAHWNGAQHHSATYRHSKLQRYVYIKKPQAHVSTSTALIQIVWDRKETLFLINLANLHIPSLCQLDSRKGTKLSMTSIFLPVYIYH